MKKQLLFLPLIAILLVSLASYQFASSTASAKDKSSDEDYEIYPIPHSLEYNEGELSLNNEFQVIYDDTIDDVTKNKLTKIFEDNDLPTPEIAMEPSDDKVTIFVGTNNSDGPAAQHTDIEGDMDFDKTDAHLLEIESGSISVIGKDTDAAFYGLVSLETIIKQSNDDTVKNLKIKDYANTEVRGFIEGFYGIPWSNDDRKSLMEFGGQFKTTSYIFAPKDDPYHRAKWDEPYPEEKLDEISDMAKVGRENKTHFVWSISPLGEVAAIAQKEGDEAAMELLEENTEKMLDKFDQLYDAGVRQFGVLGDDVGALPLDYVVELMDAVSEWADDKGDIRDTLYTPAAYNSGWAWDGGKELNKLEKHFADNIHILWTGETTVGPVEQYTIDRFKHRDNNGVVRRDPLFWLNWPVNDVDMTRVFLGKGDMLEPGIENLAGVVTNPMQEAEASKVSIFAIADYTWNTEDFSAENSWEDSMKYIEPDATEEFYTLAKHMTHAEPADGMPADESEDIKGLMDEILSRLADDETIGDIAPELMDELQTIADAGDNFMAKSKNDELKEELEPFVNALRDMVLADVEYLKASLAVEDGNKEKAWNTILSASSLRKQSLNYDRPMREGKNDLKARPAAKRLQPFTDQLENRVTHNVEQLLDIRKGESKAQAFTNVEDYRDISITESLIFTSIDDAIKVKLNKNEYIGLKLSRIKDLSDIEVTKVKGLTLQTSLNGIEWETVKDPKNPGDARYVRLINKTTNPVKFSLNTFKIESNELDPRSVIDKNVTFRDSEALNVLDGDLTTFTWFDEAQKEGQFITYDLGRSIDLDRLKVYVQADENDFPRHAVIESSVDGENWNTVMTLGNQDGPNDGEATDDDRIEDVFTKDEGDYRSEEVTDIDQEANYLRFRVTRTKEGTGNWLRMQEIEINGGKHFPEVNDQKSVIDKNVTFRDSGPLDILNGDLTTYTWFDKAQKEGQFITYDLGRKIDLNSLKVYVQANEEDYPRHAAIESSVDGENWDTVMTLGNQDGPNDGEKNNEDKIEDVFQKLEGDYRTTEVTDIEKEARFLRFRVTRTKEGTGNWLRMQEIEINGSEHYSKVNDPTVSTTSDINMDNIAHNIIDGKLTTKFEPANEKAGELIYHVGEAEKAVTGITLFGDQTKTSDNKVSVRTLQGWKEIGTIESGYNYFDLADIDTVLDIKIEWENGNTPSIYQITIDKVDDLGQVESTIQGMKSLVDYYENEGKVDGSVVRLLQTHLISIDHFVKTESYSKAVKHMKGMKQLINKYQEDGHMDKKAAKTLIRHADILIEKWQ